MRRVCAILIVATVSFIAGAALVFALYPLDGKHRELPVDVRNAIEHIDKKPAVRPVRPGRIAVA